MAFFNVNDWYWLVGNTITQVWSSSRFAYVPVNDAFYQQFLLLGNNPVQIDTAKNLGLVMATQRVPGYLASGLAIVSTGNSGVSATYALDDSSVSQLGNLARDIACAFGLPMESTTVSYPDINSNPIVCGPSDITNIYLAIRDYVASVNFAVTQLVNGSTATLPTQPVTIP